MEHQPREIKVYINDSGRKPYDDWFASLPMHVQIVVANRIDRVEQGNFGDTKPVGDGVNELRIDFGPGYRVYYGLDGRTVVLLLCGGDKKTQARDITQAKRYWNDYKENS
jgi:putative addiction module killer protein